MDLSATLLPPGLPAGSVLDLSAAVVSVPTPKPTELEIIGIEPNDDSAKITVKAYPGAVDYRVYPVQHEHAKKYSGGNTTVEWNGMDAQGVELVVEALDRLGPYQYMDDRTPHHEVHSINGQGPNDAQPVVLARSRTFVVQPQRHPLRETAVFFDGFEDEDKFALEKFPPNWGLKSSSTFEYLAYGNRNWDVLLYGADVDRTRIFSHNKHMMTILADGPTASKARFTGNNYAAAVLLPKVRPVLGDSTLHFSFEVDAHFSGRRWLEVLAYEAGTPLTNPNATRNFPQVHSTGAGQQLTWMIDSFGHRMDVTVPGESYGAHKLKVMESQCLIPEELWTGRVPLAFRTHWDQNQRGDLDQNGTTKHLDLRKRFDLYISRTHYRLMEGGQVIKQGTFTVPLRLNRVQFGLNHMAYHSSLGLAELLRYAPLEKYWIERTPYHDERHWDNIAISQLPSFPVK